MIWELMSGCQGVKLISIFYTTNQWELKQLKHVVQMQLIFFKINFTKKVSFPGCYAPTKKSLCSTSSRHLMCDEWWSSDAHVHE